MGTTPTLGLRYPEPTDRLNQVAQFIEDLAGDVETAMLVKTLSAGDPAVMQNGSVWPLGDFGDTAQGGANASGDTQGLIRRDHGIVDAWQLAVLNSNGPTFPPTAAAQFHAALPLIPGAGLRNRMGVGVWTLQSFDGSPVNSGTLRLDRTVTTSGLVWARSDKAINSSFQYSLALTWRYPDGGAA